MPVCCNKMVLSCW